MKSYIRTLTVVLSVLLLLNIAERTFADGNVKNAPTLEQRIALIEDREAIRELLVTYGRLLDDKDLSGYSKLFAKDGVWEGGIGSATGPGGIYKMLETVYSRVTPGQFGDSYHIMSDILISVSEDTASSWSRWTWIVEGEEGTPVGQRSGHYEDKLVREDGQWKFKHRLTVTELPTPERDSEARIFRTDHREDN